jgi:sugar fermentation stimulation protein A
VSETEPFSRITMATYLRRPNRFTLICRVGDGPVRAFLPNPGRLWELLLPGAVIYLEKATGEGKMPYTAVAIEREGYPVMVHTHRVNDLASRLIEKKLIPGLEKAVIVRREVPQGRSRFDFLLRKGSQEIFLEVKSCTLFSKKMAMFPDAVTSRGRRHIEELVALKGGKRSGAVLFLVFWPQAEIFLPEYHTDLEFARTLLQARKRIPVLAAAVKLRKDLSLDSRVRILDIPWEIAEREGEDRGSYILILRVRQRMKIEVGKLGWMKFREGFYLYVGSAMKNLTQRMERHGRLTKNLFWHADYLRAKAEFHAVLPIRTADDLECEMAQSLKRIADWEMAGFGSSDCECPSHLFGMKKDPFRSPVFISLLQHFRMDRLLREPKPSAFQTLPHSPSLPNAD